MIYILNEIHYACNGKGEYYTIVLQQSTASIVVSMYQVLFRMYNRPSVGTISKHNSSKYSRHYHNIIIGLAGISISLKQKKG